MKILLFRESALETNYLTGLRAPSELCTWSLPTELSKGQNLVGSISVKLSLNSITYMEDLLQFLFDVSVAA